MPTKNIADIKLSVMVAMSLLYGANAYAADGAYAEKVKTVVDDVVHRLMAENEVPGMAVAITLGGERYVFNYGLASKESGQKVDDDTIFEIGSVSKTFTATFGAYAEASGAMSFSDPASRYLPALSDTVFDKISLLELGTYTAGGLPLQFPDGVTDPASTIAYFKAWRPTYAAGTQRQYSNPSIGLFGHLAAASMGEPFDDLMANKLLPALGLTRTFIRVPQSRMDDYAFGYSKAGKPVRVNPGAFASEAYGVKTTASDLIRFVEANMGGAELDETLDRAIAATQTGYFKVGPMTQGLGWEAYPDPVALDDLMAGNATDMALKPNAAARLEPPRPMGPDMLLNKTGSTNGFGAYVAFVPAKKVGIVMLANRNFPIPARVKGAHDILTALEGQPAD